MKRIVILGSSPVGVKVIEGIRQQDSSSEITLIAFDGHYPYKRDAFAAFIAKEIASEEIFSRAKDFYDQYNVRVVLDQKISRINFNRKKIFTEDKQQFDYDVLIVTDTPENRYPDIKGTNKEYIYGYKKLKDIDRIINALPVVKTVVIQSNSFTGLQVAMSFIKREKEVVLVSSKNNFLVDHFEAEAAQWLISILEEKGVRVLSDNVISEILGDKDAKAVRLQSGKVFSTEIILFIETDEDLRLFSGSSIRTNRKIEVTPEFKADADGVFAVDQTCCLSGSEPVTPLPVLEAQGEVVAAAINGQEKAFTAPLCVRTQNIEGLVITILGDIDSEGIAVNHDFNQESGTYKGLYIKDNCIVGAVLINKDDAKDELLRNIHQKVDFAVQPEEQDTDKGLGGDEYCDGEVRTENVSTELIDN